MNQTFAKTCALLGLTLAVGYGAGAFWHAASSRAFTQALMVSEADLASIEPASGGAEAETSPTDAEKDGTDGAEAQPDDKGPAAEGDAKAGSSEEPPADDKKRSHTGKVLSKEPDFPMVNIGGARVITNRMQFEQELETATPETLKEGDEPRILRQRTKLMTYAHNPSTGPADARVTLVEFTDLACQPCMKTMDAVDKLMEAHPKDLRLVNVHTPLNRFNPVNMPAFYGKVAQRGGVFWAYRKEIETMGEATPEKYFEALMKVGMNRMQARRLMQTEARRFYRELDADAMLTKQMGLYTPPHVYVNGIHLGENFIKLEKLPDVVAYELARPFDKFGYFE